MKIISKTKMNLFARSSLFLIYFWFGVLKVFGESPANPLVESLLERTLPFMEFSTFIVLFGLFEMVLGALFLFPRLTKIAAILFVLHIITTILPLFILPAATFSSFLVPTIEGQYIIKNLALIALVMIIAAERYGRLNTQNV